MNFIFLNHCFVSNLIIFQQLVLFLKITGGALYFTSGNQPIQL
ncbi:hypothetical protein [Aquimarina hainanensis]